MSGNAIVPRWEWRTFGDELGDAKRRAADAPPDRVQESDETYLLSVASDASVKVRDALMDVKHLEALNEDGLEQWKPVMKAPFPLAAADVTRVLEALGVEMPSLTRDEYSFGQLLEELVEPNPNLRAVDVHKRRARYSAGGCMAELSEIRTVGKATRTVALESEEPTLVINAVRELGLGSRRNVNMARGLKTLAGFGARRYAVVDVGTNSVKFHVGEQRADGEWTTIADRAEITRLGEDLDETGRLGDVPMERTIEAIASMVDEAQHDDVGAIAAVGTAGLRLAPNGPAFVGAVRDRTGLDVDVITGEEEGRLAYLAATSGLSVEPSRLVVFDTGGGSTQFTFGHGEFVDERFSINVGSVRLTERYGLDGIIDDNQLAVAFDGIAAELERLDNREIPEIVVGMGGAVTNLAAVEHRLATYDPDVVQGTVLGLAEIDRQIDLYRGRNADERRQIAGLQPKRAEVILAGACIVRTVLAKLGSESLTVSDRALRHGLLVDRFGL